ncbi:MAG TPA: hypothetical protein VGR08_11560 [Thermomicrobiales bacterium]|nr:hypothetical protein [Thermomicrobiales bacterium]
MSEQSPSDDESTPEPVDWRLWPPSPKVQIVLIAAGIGLFNLMLLVIWAIVMMTQSG